MKEFVPNTLGLKIRGMGGKYVEFGGIAHMADAPLWEVSFTNRRSLACTADHKLFTDRGMQPLARLKVGDRVLRTDGRYTRIKSIAQTDRVKPVYDIIEASDGHRYSSNGVISSNCSFVTDDETLINPMTLSYIHGRPAAYFVDESRWYQEPQPNHIYLVALDPALGTENDAAAIQIYMIPGMIQVAEWQSNKTNPRGQMRALLRMLHFLDGELRSHPDQYGEPEIYWTVENNTLGESNLMVIDEIGEENFPGTLLSDLRKRGSSKRFRKGMNTNKYNKLAACATLKNLFEGGRIEAASENLVIELKNFVRAENSFKAKAGMHDDLVMALILCVRMMLTIKAQGIEVGEELSNSFSEEEIFGEALPFVV